MTEENPLQLAAISTRRNLLVVAPPGCGKTELLAMRAAALVPRLLPNQRILALTFTNRARDNLGERLRRILGIQRFRRYVRVHNFHGHAAELVLAHGRTLGMKLDDLRLPRSTTLRKALNQFSSDSGSRDAAAALLGKIKREPLSDEEVLERLDVAGDLLAKRVEVERVAANQLHYEDLLRYAQRLLRVDEIVNLYQQHYGAVLVDEFQDLSLQQLDIATRSCSTSRTFAGDPLQGIYSWAGAAPKEVEPVLRAACGEPVQLVVSYRSSPAVLGMVSGVAARMGAAPLRAYDPSSWPDGGASAALVFPTLEQEAKTILAVAEWIVRADSAASVGVISRSGYRRKKIDAAFAASTIPCRRWDLAIEDPTILDRLRTVVAGMPPDTTVQQARAQVLEGIDPSEVETIEQVEDAFDQLSLKGESTSVRGALDQFRARSDDAAIGPGAHLLSAHTGKGQQFDWVFVVGLEEGHVPDYRCTGDDDLAEEERVLLVMLSRARHGVVVTRSSTKDGRYGPWEVGASPWWGGLTATALMDWNALNAHLEQLSSRSNESN